MKSGLILSLVAVIVVFTALTLLYLAYSLIGKIMLRSGRKSRNDAFRKDVPEGDEAAAVALALALETTDKDEEQAAAVALALHRWLGDTVHDQESYVITII